MKYTHFKMYKGTKEDDMDSLLFWGKMEQEGKVDKVFWDKSVTNYEEFKNFIKKTWFFFGYDRYRLVGGVWFYDFIHTECKIGICSFSGYKYIWWIKPINELLEWLLDNQEHIVYNIIALTPHRGIERLFSHFGFLYMGKDEKSLYRLVRSKK